MRTQMKKALPRLNRRLPKDFQGGESTWWELSVGISQHIPILKTNPWHQRPGADGVGFEPTVPLRARRFSRPVP